MAARVEDCAVGVESLYALLERVGYDCILTSPARRRQGARVGGFFPEAESVDEHSGL